MLISRRGTKVANWVRRPEWLRSAGGAQNEKGLSAGGTSLQGNLLSDHLLGSLPAGLSHVQRNEILSSSVLSPTQSAMSSLPSEKLVRHIRLGRPLLPLTLRGHWPGCVLVLPPL